MPRFQVSLPQGPNVPADMNVKLEQSLTRHFGQRTVYSLNTPEKIVCSPPFVISFESELKRSLDAVGLRESAREAEPILIIKTELKVA